MNVDVYFMGCMFIGLIGGILAAFIGIGTGLLSLPFFIHAMPYIGVPANMLPEVVVCTATTCMAVTSTMASIVKHKNREVHWHVVLPATSIGIAGMIAGIVISHYIPANYFEKVIGVFLLLVLFSSACRKPLNKAKPFPFTSKGLIGLLCGVVAAFSGLCGALCIPILSRKLPYREAIGTSVTIAALFLWMTSGSYIVIGVLHSHGALNTQFLGYLHWPSFVVTGIAGFIGAKFIGSKLSRLFSPTWTKKIVTILIAAVALKMLF